MLVQVGPHIFTITFYVMDIQPVHFCLLGSPWIHVVGVVTSILHQKVKFIIGGKVVTLCEEEEHIVSHLASLTYIEVEGDIYEMPFQAAKIPHSIEKKSEAPVSSLK